MSSHLFRHHLLKPLSSQRPFSCSASLPADFTHVVIGAGVVGLAIARKLAERAGTSTLLIERHGSIGTETSSRNSEVIHAGLYYGADTLKTRLCLRGKKLLYALCKAQKLPYRNTKKWIVAQDDEQFASLESLHAFARSLDIDTRFVSASEAQRSEPLVRAGAGVLESASTGILDSHALMTHLEGVFQSLGGDTAFHTTVTGLARLPTSEFSITTTSTSTSDSTSPITTVPTTSTITSETLINSAGLSAIQISNLLLPPSRHLTPFYAKGTYFSYSAPPPHPLTLIYPAPSPGSAGLGTHLTLDLANPPRIRFGPDVEWVTSPNDYTPNPARLAPALDAIQTYFPSLRRECVHLDYCGIRPKLGRRGAVGAGSPGFQDFVIRGEEGFGGFVNLLGIESPGLTSSLAIAEMVEGLLYR